MPSRFSTVTRWRRTRACRRMRSAPMRGGLRPSHSRLRTSGGGRSCSCIRAMIPGFLSTILADGAPEGEKRPFRPAGSHKRQCIRWHDGESLANRGPQMSETDLLLQLEISPVQCARCADKIGHRDACAQCLGRNFLGQRLRAGIGTYRGQDLLIRDPVESRPTSRRHAALSGRHLFKGHPCRKLQSCSRLLAFREDMMRMRLPRIV